MAFLHHFVTSYSPCRRLISGKLICNRSLWNKLETFRGTFLETTAFTGKGVTVFLSPEKWEGIQRKGSSLQFRALSTDSPISEEALGFVEEAVEKDSVVVFSKSWCPYCAKVKGLFQSLQVPFKTYDLDKLSTGEQIQAALLKKTGQRTVPNVFILKQHVGGCSETLELFENGTLAKLLEKAEIHIN
ncbi:Glutaredoxin-C2 [Galdieria sulphuraria]|uniref:Glutaredoxin 3 n=1 Tax=Galdieria sulphuraria TaxID=130081 RepID=M2Y7H7_GALSU|nr:glutaredoxin 3 [Galdieria sulphuraria]EME32008.1 glutaredoxin 3 [Galdieria sulphuraria]GJD09875.1 Glutaredoxin-C2 [Galdieria sulphuraria]|eukprot:XP_005708528.1 glutaredoxin 3 [Galdieria sulphuraria]